MLSQRVRNSGWLGNLVWFIASMLMAIGVWYIAVTAADPIASREFRGLPVQIVQDDSVILTNNPTRFADVTIRGAQTVIDSRRDDDIIIRANLIGLPAGTHTIPLEASVALPESEGQRRILAETQPTQITVTLEQIESFQNPVEIIVSSPPPTGYTTTEPVPAIFQAVVKGASSVVSQVVAVRGTLDLADKRNSTEADVRLFAVDADGNRVIDVTIEPANTTVSVDITRRDDVKQVAVRPNILVGTQPAGYTLSTFSYSPQTIFIGGNATDLATIDDTFFTMPIDLTGHTEDFQVVVPVELPSKDLFVLGSDNNITVTVNILPQIASRQIDNIPVERIGLAEGLSVTLAPQFMSAILTGPSAIIDQLLVNDVQIVVDLNGLVAGSYDLPPTIVINQGELSADNASLLPAVISVDISNTISSAEVTVEPSPTLSSP